MAGPHALQPDPTPPVVKKTKNLAWLYGVVGGLVGLFLIGGAVSNDVAVHSHSCRSHGSAWERMEAHLSAHAARRDSAWHPSAFAILLDETLERRVLCAIGLSRCKQRRFRCAPSTLRHALRHCGSAHEVVHCYLWVSGLGRLSSQMRCLSSIYQIDAKVIWFFHHFVFKYFIFVAMIWTQSPLWDVSFCSGMRHLAVPIRTPPPAPGGRGASRASSALSNGPPPRQLPSGVLAPSSCHVFLCAARAPEIPAARARIWLVLGLRSAADVICA